MIDDARAGARERRGGPHISMLSSLVLGLAMGVSTLLGYGFTVVVSRSLGPADFGALSALVSLGLLGAIPAGALQVVVARRISAGESPDSSVLLAILLGVGLALAALLVSPLAVAAFHLVSPMPMVALALTLIPMTLTGALQGVLLTREGMGPLSSVYLVGAITRFGAGGMCAVLGWGVTEVLFAVAIAAGLTACWALWLCRSWLRRLTRARIGPFARETFRSSQTLASLIALTTVDLLLARHFLTAQESGEYALAALFGKLVFWGTQFVALVLVPKMPHSGGQSALRRALAAIVGVGGLATAAVLMSPSFWITSIGGVDYADAASLVVGFTLLGTGWALVQVLLFSHMGRNSARVTAPVWLATAMEAGLVICWWHNSSVDILGAAAIATGAVLVAAVALEFQRPARSSTSMGYTRF